MKLFLSLLFLSTVWCSFAEERVYIPSEKLVMSDQGIFFKAFYSFIPLGSISYDYNHNGFYLSQQEILLVTCPRCGQQTYSPKYGICFNPSCPYQDLRINVAQ